MVLSKVVIQLQRLRQFHLENAKDHKKLIRVLDCIQLETIKVILTQSPTKIAVEIASFEELATLASHFYERDQVLKDSVDRTLHLVHAVRPEHLKKLKDKLRVVKRELGDVKEKLRKENVNMQKTMKRITLVVEEFRSRCRETYTEYLKGLDLDLRKILKPLVPSKVLDEQIKYRNINYNPSVQSSLQSTIRSELREGHEPEPLEGSSADFDPQGEARDQATKLNAHIELLVNTLETVAKDLIGLCGDVNRRYYEVVDPRELISGPPTPLAAPLPEYFSFKAADYIEDQLELMNIVDPTIISDSQRQILVEKLMKLNKDGHLSDHLLQPEKAEKLRKKLESVGKRHMDIRELNLEDILNDDTIMPATEREKLVYSLINSERPGSKDVTLDEIINATEDSDTDSVRLVEHPREQRRKKQPSAKHRKVEELEDFGPPPPIDQSGAGKDSDRVNKSDIVDPPLLTDVSYDGKIQYEAGDQQKYGENFYTPQGEAVRKQQSFFEQHRKSLPPIMKLDKKGSRSTHGMKVGGKQKEARQSKETKVRSVTPVQVRRSREEKKPSPVKKTSKSPVPASRKVKSAAYSKKHSMS